MTYSPGPTASKKHGYRLDFLLVPPPSPSTTPNPQDPTVIPHELWKPIKNLCSYHCSLSSSATVTMTLYFREFLSTSLFSSHTQWRSLLRVTEQAGAAVSIVSAQHEGEGFDSHLCGVWATSHSANGKRLAHQANVQLETVYRCKCVLSLR